MDIEIRHLQMVRAVAASGSVTRAANDKQQAVPMARTALSNLEAARIPRPLAADGTAVRIPNTAEGLSHPVFP